MVLILLGCPMVRLASKRRSPRAFESGALVKDQVVAVLYWGLGLLHAAWAVSESASFLETSRVAAFQEGVGALLEKGK